MTLVAMVCSMEVPAVQVMPRAYAKFKESWQPKLLDLCARLAEATPMQRLRGLSADYVVRSEYFEQGTRTALEFI